MLVIHGGAGTLLKKEMTAEKEKAYRSVLQYALTTGYKVLNNGGTSLDAVEATIKIMEDSPLFNAGKGAVFTHEGTNEMDASIMDGETLDIGAIACIEDLQHPVSVAGVAGASACHATLFSRPAPPVRRSVMVRVYQSMNCMTPSSYSIE